MPNDVKGWASVISSVKTELGLLALVLLVVGAFFAFVSGKSGADLGLVVKAFVLIILLVIILAGVLLFYRERRVHNESLKQNRHFATLLGAETYHAYSGAIEDLLSGEQEQAYRDFYDIMSSSRLFESAAEKAFVKELIDTVRHNAEKAREKREPKGNPPVISNPGKGD